MSEQHVEPVICTKCGAVDDRLMGYSDNDRIQFWVCLECGYDWNRFSPESPYWAEAERVRARAKGMDW